MPTITKCSVPNCLNKNKKHFSVISNADNKNLHLKTISLTNINDASSTENISFHCFPFVRPEILKKWIEFINVPGFQPRNHDGICSIHFEKSCFFYNCPESFDSLSPQSWMSKFLMSTPSKSKSNYNNLKKDAVPTLLRHPTTEQFTIGLPVARLVFLPNINQNVEATLGTISTEILPYQNTSILPCQSNSFISYQRNSFLTETRVQNHFCSEKDHNYSRNLLSKQSQKDKVDLVTAAHTENQESPPNVIIPSKYWSNYVSLGNVSTRWNKLKQRGKFSNDSQFASHLLDLFDKFDPIIKCSRIKQYSNFASTAPENVELIVEEPCDSDMNCIEIHPISHIGLNTESESTIEGALAVSPPQQSSTIDRVELGTDLSVEDSDSSDSSKDEVNLIRRAVDTDVFKLFENETDDILKQYNIKMVDKMVCGHCLRGYETAAETLSHERDAHQQATFSCPLCHFRSPVSSQLNAHIYSHRPSGSREALLSNRAVKAFAALVCEFCFRRFPTEGAANEHRAQAHQTRQFTCFGCEYTTSRRAALLQHLNREHFTPERDFTPEREFTTKRDLTAERDSEGVGSVSRDETRQSPAREGNKSTESETKIKVKKTKKSSDDVAWLPSSESPESSAESDSSSESSDRDSDWSDGGAADRKPKKPHKPAASRPGSVYCLPHSTNCLFCHKYCRDFKEAKQHVMEDHADRLVACPHCHVRTVSEALLKRHIHVHRERHCPNCDARFTDAREMFNHRVKVHHDYSQAHVCDTCGECFRSGERRNRHVRRDHEGKRYACAEPGCAREFRSQNSLQQHMSIAHSDIRYECPRCGLQFNTKHGMRKHVRTVHEGRKKHRCAFDGCGQMFASSYTLRMHQRRHTDEKPMSCCLCEYRCRQRASLTWHYRKQHAEYPEQELRAMEKSEVEFVGVGRSEPMDVSDKEGETRVINRNCVQTETMEDESVSKSPAREAEKSLLTREKISLPQNPRRHKQKKPNSTVNSDDPVNKKKRRHDTSTKNADNTKSHEKKKKKAMHKS